MRYRIQPSIEGLWMIINIHDQNLAWCSSHWYPRDEEGQPLSHFLDYVSAADGSDIDSFLSNLEKQLGE
jgi:hypothetical protein